MDEYNILYSISRNKIIIPHYNLNSDLIGIRGRALNLNEIEQFGKYMPVEIEGKWYTHPLSYNLYGLNVSQEHIRKNRRVIIYEGEKSCLKHHSFFPDWNISVAVCGSTLNKSQIDLLIKNFALDEIILAFDKEYVNYSDEKGRKYLDKLSSLCKKYNNYCNFSFIYDKENLLREKDSPVDRGQKIFKELYDKRIKVRSLLL
jgi:DNA primase